LVRSSSVNINGTEFPVSFTIGPEEYPLLPHRFPVGHALRAGQNVITVTVPSTLETALRGEVRLLVAPPAPPASRIVATGPDTFELHHHGVCDVVEWCEDRCAVRRADGNVITFSETVAAVCDRRSATSPDIDVYRAPVMIPRGREEILAALTGTDWRAALAALEAAEGTTDAGIVEATWKLLQREAREHATLPARRPDDVCWYRLKATAARVLGAARYEPATELLGQILLGRDMYPARVACAWALGQIATPAAQDWLQRVPAHDEWNTMFEAKRWLVK
jgi:hypothetical protein